MVHGSSSVILITTELLFLFLNAQQDAYGMANRLYSD